MAVFFFMVCFPLLIQAEVPEYTVKRVTEKIVIDGILDDSDWQAAEPAGDFSFPWKESTGEKEQTEAKLLWDDNFLYVSFKCEDSCLNAERFDTNAETYRDDAVEIFWNPNPETPNRYYIFEFNCVGNILSVHKPFDGDPGGFEFVKERKYRVMVPHIAQSIQGTLNKDDDTDTGFVVEAAIRFSDYPELSKKPTPVAGDMWRVGLNRLNWKPTQELSMWSPVLDPEIKTFHSPEYYGKIVFSDESVQ